LIPRGIGAGNGNVDGFYVTAIANSSGYYQDTGTWAVTG